MLWVYGHYNYCNSFSAGIVYRREILMSKDGPRTERVHPSTTKVHFCRLTKKDFCVVVRVNAYPAKLNNFNFQPLEVVSRYRDPQLQEAENYSQLFYLSTNIGKSGCLHPHFIPNNSDLVD